jgi:acetoacetyl-CoA synthetase
MSSPNWTPSQARAARAQITTFRLEAAEGYGLDLPDYDSLWRWSVEHPAEFWSELWRFSGVLASRPWDTALVNPGAMPGVRWFEAARLNFAENLLRRRDGSPAIIAVDERGRRRELSYEALYASVASVAGAMRVDGVEAGDRVAAYLPNVPEAVVAMLAAASIGAVFSSCSPDFGARGVLDRFGQIEPKLLFCADGYTYGGKAFSLRERVDQVCSSIPSIRRAVLVPFLDQGASAAGLPGGVLFEDYGRERGERDLEFEQLPFDHPLYILYSSGTTGVPKCIVHGAGGTLLQHLKEHRLHTDVRPGDRVFYFTTCGWMMWNWLVSALASDATVVLYEGSPMHPGPSRLFELAEQERIRVFGTSPRFLGGAMKAGLEPARTFDLSCLDAILSTGAPLSPELFDYVYESVKGDLCLSSISGGTDIVSCFALGNPAGPVHRGELQCRGLGMKVEVFDSEGRSVVGEKGELVCTAPFPSMPVGFFADEDGARYRAAYFERYPDIWHHGDYAELNERGGMVIHGRSDAVLNPGGVRIGTGEIYRLVEQLDEVVEAVAVGQDHDGDVRVLLFVRLRDGVSLDAGLESRLRRHIRENATPRHVPALVEQVADIPRTISGKIAELAVSAVLEGREVKNRDALANPEALDLFKR